MTYSASAASAASPPPDSTSHAVDGLEESLAKTKAVTAELERASDHAMVIETVLEHELAPHLKGSSVAQVIEQTGDLKEQLADSAEKLTEVSAELRREIAERRLGA